MTPLPRWLPAATRRPRRLWTGIGVAGLAAAAAVLLGGGGTAVPAPATAAQLQPPFVNAGRMFASDGRPHEHYGYAVALDGNTLAVGARNARVGNNGDQGAVYVYVRSGADAGWTLQQKLTAADGDTNHYLGEAVALQGDVIVAGAPGRNSNRGALYEFQRTGSTWAQHAQTSAPRGGDTNVRFGAAVAMSGDTLAAGAPGASVNGQDSAGAVDVFTRSGSAWSQQAQLTASDAFRTDEFGTAVALDGDRLLAGAPFHDGTNDDEGRVYAFARSGSVWTEQQRLAAPSPDGEDHFGTAVALDGSDAIGGAPGRDGAERDQGAAFAFAYAAGVWNFAKTLTFPAGAESVDAEFGAAAALDAGVLAVGAPRNPATSREHEGGVYTFEGGQGAWTLRQALLVAGASGEAHVGASVAVSGGTLVAGAPDDDYPKPEGGIGNRQGSVTTFELFAAADDAYSTDEGRTLTIAAPGVLSNDANPSGGALSAELVSGPAHGALTLNSDGSFSYTPAPGFSGADSFSYQARSGDAASSVATVTITVRPVPVAVDDSYATDRGTALIVSAATGVLANDTGGIAPLTAGRGGGPAHGTLALGVDGSLFYLPAAGFFGQDTFTYTASDGVNTSAPATVTITVRQVLPPVRPPQALNDGYSTDQGVPLTVTASIGVLANDGGTRPLSAGAASDPPGGTVILAADGSFVYTPDPGFTGADTFTYTASNSAGSDTATVRITVKSVSPPVQPPQALDDAYSTDQDVPLSVAAPTGVLANDLGTRPLSAGGASNPPNGTVTLAADGSFAYTPDAGFFGTDSFTYTASNSAGTDPATVTISVRQVAPPAVPPNALDDPYSTPFNTTLTVAVATGVLSNDTGTRPMTAGGATDPPGGTVTLAADGSLSYTPDAGFSGADTFTYTATNAAGADTATVTVTVQAAPPVIVAPDAADDSYATPFNTPLTVPIDTGVLANDTGSRPMSAGGASDPPGGTVTLAADGSLSYTPDAGFSGADTFTYTATNAAGADTATVTVTVQEAPPVVVAPDAADDSYATPFNTPLTVPAATGVLANDTGSRPMTAAGASDPPGGTVTLNADGSLSYTPDAGFSGADTFTYTASNAAGTDTATVTVTVQAPPNRPPIAGNDAFTTAQDTPLVITAADVLANDSDPDGDPLTFAVPTPLTNPDHGRLTQTGPDTVTYTPQAGFSGTDTFTYAVSDGRDNSAPATITITVTAAVPPDPGGGEVIVVPAPGGGSGTPEAGPIPLPSPNPPNVVRACRVRLDVTVGGQRITIAGARERYEGRRRISLNVSRRGMRMLGDTVGGVPVTLRAVCRTREGEVVGRAERRVLVLRTERVVTPPGSWVPDQAVLTAGGKRFIRALAGRLRPRNVTRLRCDGHTALAPASPVEPMSLSRRRARLVCGRLRQASLRAAPRIVPHAGKIPIATNATEPGRAANRRVAVVIVHGRTAPRGRASLVGDRGGGAIPAWPPAPPERPSGRSPQGA